jgi:UDP:flavonoid glycosyltransferase YjiC (YdhE family)
MRVLFAFAGGHGHADPLLPIAKAAEAAGHTVAVTGRPGVLPAIEQVGLTAIPTGAASDTAPRRQPLVAPDQEREDRVFRDYFAGSLACDRAVRVLALSAQWQPDIIVCDETDFGSMIAAERTGIPYASVVVISAGSFVRPALIVEPLNELRSEHGLPPDPELTMLSRYLVLSPSPPGFRDPSFPPPATTHWLRPMVEAPRATAPVWLADLDRAPTVYFTLGTEFNNECGDLFERIVTGLSGLPINLVVTVGREIDPAEFGPQPAHVRIEQYIAQSVLLPCCDAVVSHGGSGSVIGALTHGLPSVLLPMGADQPLNAARCAALGVALVLDPVMTTPEIAAQAVTTVLTEPAYRLAAGRMRDEIAALPGPDHAVKLLEGLVAHAHRSLAAER